MKATLIESDSHKRYYELSEPITKGKSDIIGDIPDLIEECTECVKEGFRKDYRPETLDLISEGIRYVVVSDSYVHIERLVFPAVRYKDGEFHWFSQDIAGKHTYSIDGGDPDSVYPDEVYLRYLARLNGLTYEGIE